MDSLPIPIITQVPVAAELVVLVAVLLTVLNQVEQAEQVEHGLTPA
jgi:hypothetical protein